MNTLSIALKEWNLLIDDLLAGRQAILLRKGGILEANNEFELDYKKFLLYPTFIHQDPRMVKESRRAEIQTTSAEPSLIHIRGHAEVVKILEVPSRQKMDALNDLHLWDAPFLDMRFNYRPEKPLYLLILRTFKLDTPTSIESTLEYAGCKSWIPLNEKIDTTNSTQSLPEESLQSLLTHIQKTFQ